MKKNKELNNIIFEFLYFALTIVSNFITRKIIINLISIELVGLNNVLNQVINFVSLFEFGISYIIMSYLYRPLKTKDEQRITEIMNCFKKIYLKVSMLIIIVGISVIPLLKYFINDYSLSINYVVIYILLLVQSSVINYLSYKTFLIRADQKAYLYLRLLLLLKLISLIIEIVLFIFTKNYYIYFVVSVIDNVLSYFIISKYINKKYPFMKNKCETQKDDLNTIRNQIKNTAICKVCMSLYNSLDTLILGFFSSVKVMGIYSNYYVLLNTLNTIAYKLFYSIQSKLGNIAVDQNDLDSYKLLHKMNSVAYILGAIFSVSFYLFADLIIILWAGKEYLFDRYIVIAFSIELFVMIYRTSLWQYTIIKGWFKINKISDMIGVFINLILSIVLYLNFGIIGVILGTAITEIIKHFIELYLIIKRIDIKYKNIILYNLRSIAIYIIIICTNNYFIILLFLILLIMNYFRRKEMNQ